MKYFTMDMRRPQLIKNLLEKWDQTLRDFEKVITVEDLPYVYGERTNIGLLAAAATKTGFIVLEEYALQKRQGRQYKPGRADLWLYNAENSLDISIEAKCKELSWNSKRVAELIKPILEDAVHDVEEVRPSEGAKYSLGIVFIRPCNANPHNFNPSDFWTQLSDRSLLSADFCLMHLCKYNIWSQQKYNKGYPGIVILGKFSK